MQKGITIAIAIVLAIFIGGIIVIYSSIGSVISDSIVNRGTQITQTAVTLDAVDYSTSTGLATLTNLKVANPSGFKSKYALNFSRVDIWIDPETLSKEKVLIKALTLVAPEITYEISDTTDNLRTLKSYIEASIRRALSAGPDKKFIIENYIVENGVVVVESADLKGARKTAKLANIRLTNIGQSEGGLRAEQLTQQLLLPLLRETTLAALNTDLPLTDQARNILNGAADETEKAIQLFKNLIN